MRNFYLWCILFLLGGGYICAQTQQRRTEVRQEEKDSLADYFKGSYLTVSGNIGGSSLNYKLNSLGEKGSRSAGLGYGIDVKYSYFFHPHWGITSGVGISYYGTTGKLKGSLAEDKFHNLGKLTDNDWQPAPKDYELRARVTNLEEKQTTYLLEVPLMVSYHTYFREQGSCWGIYGGLGAKLQFPVSPKFKIKNGGKSEFNVSGQYDGIPVDMGSPLNPPVPQHGYGTITDPNSSLDWNDKAKLKMGVAATAELGVLFSLSKTTDLQIGGYIDYGLTDIKKNGNRGLFAAPSAYHPGADNKVGNGIKYNGMLNSNVTGKIRPISFGVKIGLKFKMGGDKENRKQEEK